MIPIPPTHCVNWRQRRSEWSTAPTSVRIDAPVVEKPDIDSKNASTGRSSCGSPESRYGIAAEDGREQPRQRDDEIALAEADGGRARAEALEPEAGGEGDRAGGEERPGRLAIDDRDGGRHERRGAEELRRGSR